MTPNDTPLPSIDPDDRPTRPARRSAPVAAATGQRPLIVRLLPMVIVALALGGFSGIVGYYYFAGTSNRGGEGPAPLVKAEAKPEKVRPENPGGMDVPHQDKEIYDKVVASGGRGPVSPTAERLLPPPETPLPRPGTPMGANATVAPTFSTAPPRPGNAPLPPIASIPAPPNVTPPPPAMVTSEAVIPAAPAPMPAVPVAPVTVTQPPAAPAQRLAATAPPAAAPAVTRPVSATGGGSRVAIASVRSEAEARREWDRLRRQHGDALGSMSADFIPADLGEKGVYWRIYVGPSESHADAQARCSALKTRQISCFVARP
jgi:hypothetical protein